MEINIVSDGHADGTKISINGEDLTPGDMVPGDGKPRLKFFEFSVNAERSGKAKLIMQKMINGKWHYFDYFGESFKMYDKTQEIKEAGNVIGGKSGGSKNA